MPEDSSNPELIGDEKESQYVPKVYKKNRNNFLQEHF